MDIEQPVIPAEALGKENQQLLNSQQEDTQNHDFRPEHADYLEDCFINRIGLSPNQPQEVSITSFDGVLVAKGYNRIVTTYQGYFIEIEKEDLETALLEPNESPANGEESWLSRGVKVFRLT